MPKNIQEWLSWLIKLRIVVATTLLGVILGVESVVSIDEAAKGLSQVVFVIYVMSAIHYLFLRFHRKYVWQAYLQTCSDLLVISAIIYCTGGMDSYFLFLYLLSIIMASILLYRRGAYMASTLSACLVVAQYWLTEWGILPSTLYNVMEPRTVRYLIGTNIFAFYAVAYLSSHLSETLRRTGSELEDKSGKLASLQAFNENIINSMRGGLFTTNLDGFITLFNRSASEISGFSQDTAMGMHIGRVFGETAWRGSAFSDDQLPFRFERTIKNSNGHELYLGFTVSPFLIDGRKQIGYVFTFQDLTEIKELEQQVMQKDRMAALGKMAASIAHEIRNPLTAITGSFQVLKTELPLNPDQYKLAENISLEIRRLYRIVTEFLGYARPVNYSPRLVDLKALTKDTVELIRNSPEISTNHQIEYSLSNSDDSFQCQGDPDLIRQIYWNLCGNAVKAMPEGGRLSINLENTNSGEVKISFEDTGKGFTLEEQEKIFEPFQSSFSGGTGLGLSIVSQIIAAHKGSIKVSSVKDKGTVFQIILPRYAEMSDMALSA